MASEVVSKMKNEQTALVQFNERVIDSYNEQYHAQQFKLLVREIGKKYTTVVVRVLQTNVELFRGSLTRIFLDAVGIENRVRRQRKLRSVKVFILVPVESFLGSKSQEQNQFHEFSLLDCILHQSKVSGVVFETLLFLSPIHDQDGMFLTVNKVLKLMKELKLCFGYELKLGVAINSIYTCAASLESVLYTTMPSFDMVVYTHELPQLSQNESKSDVYIKKCIKLYQRKFPKIAFYKIQQDVEITFI